MLVSVEDHPICIYIYVYLYVYIYSYIINWVGRSRLLLAFEDCLQEFLTNWQWPKAKKPVRWSSQWLGSSWRKALFFQQSCGTTYVINDPRNHHLYCMYKESQVMVGLWLWVNPTLSIWFLSPTVVHSIRSPAGLVDYLSNRANIVHLSRWANGRIQVSCTDWWSEGDQHP